MAILTISLTSSTLTTFAGDIRVGGNDIQSSSGSVALSLSGANVTIPGTLNVNGNTTLGDTNSDVTTVNGE
jgi:predicted ribosome-associated RNA-binding protein Tma20